MDTTAVETNIHYPTDSWLLSDTCRVLDSLIERVRKIDPRCVGSRRLHTTRAKKTHTTISRKASKTPGNQEKLKPCYERLIEQVTGICQWADGICKDINRRVSKRCSTELKTLADEIAGKFITAYDVFDKKPNEHTLVEPALARHKELFGSYPDSIAADKGYYESMEAIEKLNKKIKIVSIAKKGKRTEDEKLRESDPEFRFAQRFRAGAEGGISYLKRILGLFRCFPKGWEHYVSTVAATIFTHNVLVLARE
jgi:hypothetical protein